MASQQLITHNFQQQKAGTSRGKGHAQKSTANRPKTDTKHIDDAPVDLGRRKDLDALREFDLDWRFGPCTGITRLERWERADSHGHNPPQGIKQLILDHKDDEEYVQNIWSGYPL